MYDRHFLKAKQALSAPLLAATAARGVLARRVAGRMTDAEAERNIHAVGIGPKIRGLVPTKIDAIRVYVVQKMGADRIPARHLIPREVNGIPTDVIESAPAKFAACPDPAFQQRQRPVVGGISASHFLVTGGTVGCRCHSTVAEDAGRIFALSCHHVFGPLNAANVGDDLFQPARRETCAPGNDPPFATFARNHPLVFDDTNEVDAAIGRLLVEMTNEVFSFGAISGTFPGSQNMPVGKHGRGSGRTSGIITDASYDHTLELGPGDGQTLRFVNQLKIEPSDDAGLFATDGDSGAIVLGPGNKAVGLLFAIDRESEGNNYAIANRIELVEEHLKIRLVS